MLAVAQDYKNRVEDFKPYIPLIQGLRNQGMRIRHWDMLSEELGFNIRPKKDLTFQKCLDMKLDQYTEQINKVKTSGGIICIDIFFDIYTVYFSVILTS